MHVVTFTRSTPDTAAHVEVNADGVVTWGNASTIVNPWDEYALEETILQAENSGGTSTVIAVGPEMHNDALKHSLAMGIKEAIRIWDPALDTIDSLAYATAAAAAISKLGDVNLVIVGKESIDTGTDQHNIQIARKLGWPMLSNVSRILEVNSETGTIKVERTLEHSKQVASSKLPAVVSVLKDINEPRYPSFAGIRKAGKAQIPEWSLADLSVELPQAQTQVVAYHNLPTRDIEVEMLGGTPKEQATRLVEKLSEEKVI